MPSFGTLKADTLTHSTAGSLATNYVVEGTAKGFSFYDASDNIIRESLNLSTVTDRGTGRNRSNFTNNFVNEYVQVSSTNENPTGGSDAYYSIVMDDKNNGGGQTSGTCNVASTYGRDSTNTFWDADRQHQSFRGDLA